MVLAMHSQIKELRGRVRALEETNEGMVDAVRELMEQLGARVK